MVELQCLYIMRPHCRVIEQMGNKLIENVLELDLPDSASEMVLARVITAMGQGPKGRSRLLNEALDIIEIVRDGSLEEELEGGDEGLSSR